MGAVKLSLLDQHDYFECEDNYIPADIIHLLPVVIQQQGPK